MADEVVKAVGVSCGYGSPVVSDVDLTIQRGEIVGLLGASGSGKSTLLRTLGGLLPPLAGRVELFGRDLYHLPNSERQTLLSRAGMLFQKDALFGSMSVLENVCLPLNELTHLPAEVARKMARARLSLVNLNHLERRQPADLSGGERKRAALARATITDPAILFCDEPTSGLDPTVAAQVEDALLLLRDTLRVAVVAVTHDPASIRKIADRIVFLRGGSIQAEGSVRELEQSAERDVYNFFHRINPIQEEPMASKAQQTKLAIFMLGSGALLTILVVTLVGAELLRKYDYYHVYVPQSVEGLAEGAPVKRLGVRVGRVDQIELVDSQAVKLTLEVREQLPIPSDAEALLKHAGLTGQKLVDITGGTAHSPRLSPGDRIPHGDTTLGILSDSAQKLSVQAAELMNNTSKLVASLTSISKHLELRRVDSALERADRTMGNLETASLQLSALVSESRAPLRRSLTNLEQTTSRTQKLTINANGVVKEAGAILEHMDKTMFNVSYALQRNRGDIRATTPNLRQASQSFKELGRQLRQQPSQLLIDNPPKPRELP